jgi:hypothetical protein
MALDSETLNQICEGIKSGNGIISLVSKDLTHQDVKTIADAFLEAHLNSISFERIEIDLYDNPALLDKEYEGVQVLLKVLKEISTQWKVLLIDQDDHYEALANAISNNQIGAVQVLLAVDDSEDLVAAIKDGDVEIIKFLIKHKITDPESVLSTVKGYNDTMSISNLCKMCKLIIQESSALNVAMLENLFSILSSVANGYIESSESAIGELRRKLYDESSYDSSSLPKAPENFSDLLPIVRDGLDKLENSFPVSKEATHSPEETASSSQKRKYDDSTQDEILKILESSSNDSEKVKALINLVKAPENTAKKQKIEEEKPNSSTLMFPSGSAEKIDETVKPKHGN